MHPALRTLLFLAYALIGAPLLQRMMRTGLESATTVVLPALIVIAALLAETIALPLFTRALRHTPSPHSSLALPMLYGAAAAIAHMILSYFLLFSALDSLGVLGAKLTSSGSVILGASAVVMFFREAFLFFALTAQRPLFSKCWQLVAELLLIFFQCVAYTVYWETLIGIERVSGIHWSVLPLLAAAVLLVFQIVYLPIRLPEMLAIAWQTPPAEAQRKLRLLWLESIVLGLYPLFWH